MKTITVCNLWMLLCWTVPVVASGQTEMPKTDASTKICLMSFNIRNGQANDGENKWENRKDFVCDVVKEHALDIVGLQEAFHFQLQYMLEKLPHFEAVGQGRDGGERGEYSAILFNKNRFTLQDSGTFWLSDTPEKKSRSWGNRYLRVCTWARLMDKGCSHAFYIYNTHLDHQSQNARIQSAKLITRRIAQRRFADPFVLMGDMNAAEDNPVIQYFKGKINLEGTAPSPLQLKDTFRILHPEAKPTGTGGGFIGRTTGPKIDYIFVPVGIKTIRASIVRINRSGAYPSDHFPVFAEINFSDTASSPHKRK